MMAEIESFELILDRFLQQLDSLKNSLPSLMAVSTLSLKRQSDKYSSSLEKYGTLKKDTGRKKRYEIAARHIRKIERAKKRLEHAHIAIELIPRSFIITFVAQYDAFLGNLLKAIFLTRPELQNDCDRSIKLRELANFSSIEEARSCLVSKEIESLLRKSHSDQFEWMEKKFKVPLRKGLDSWPIFIELTERRNLYVHCDGIISEQYLAVCKHHKALPEESAKVGACLEVSPHYVLQAHNCLYEIAVKLCQVLWRKLFPDQLEDADNHLISITYELLVLEDYPLAKNLLFFATETLKKHSSEAKKFIFTVNRAIAYKFSGEEEKCNEIIGSIDCSALGLEFKLAIAVLQDDFEKAAQLMEAIGPNGAVTEQEYEEWPLFRKFRETTEFTETYERVFGNPFSEEVEEVSVQ